MKDEQHEQEDGEANEGQKSGEAEPQEQNDGEANEDQVEADPKKKKGKK